MDAFNVVARKNERIVLHEVSDFVFGALAALEQLLPVHFLVLEVADAFRSVPSSPFLYLGRLTQGLLLATALRLQFFVDDPAAAVTGDTTFCDFAVAAVGWLWRTANARLAFLKSRRAQSSR